MRSDGRSQSQFFKWYLIIFAILFSLFLQTETQAFTLTVVDGNGIPITGGFRYLLEEDNTNLTIPGAAVANSIGVSIHNSHAPVITSGNSGGVSAANVAVTQTVRYFVSVLPDSGYSNGGAMVLVGQNAVVVTVQALPLPTAQISVLVFVDQRPINNAWDEGEPGLGGSTVVVSDAGGPLSADAFSNPLGTVYQFDPVTNQPLFDVNGNPIVIQLGTGVITTLTQKDFNAALGFDVDGVTPLPGGPDPTKNPYKLKVGEALVKYIAPGKYGVVIVPPRLDDAGRALTFVQTTTIEGTPVIDAWVKAKEPSTFVEGFGIGFKHVTFGFVKTSPDYPQTPPVSPGQLFKGQLLTRTPWNETPPMGAGSITGTLRFNHFARPPTTQGFNAGEPVAECWVGLNDPLAQREITTPAGTEAFTNVGLYYAQCNPDSTFTIPNVPPGTYQLVTWDTALDSLFGFQTVTVPPAGGTVALGDILTFRWFGTLKGSVFYDHNQNGFRDCVTPACNDPLQDDFGISNQNVNIRFRDGSIYQFQPTDPFGDYEFAEVFPFFKWLVVEVDFLRFKATGITAVVDFGGAIPAHAQAAPPFPTIPPGPQFISTTPSFNVLNPQPQYVTPNVPYPALPGGPTVPNPNTGNGLSRTETGPILTQAMHLFLNQTNVIDWGKSNYGPLENGGIAGIVYYATTRAENDPRFAAAEPWEPGIPRVQVNLYEDFNNDGIADGAAIATAFTDSWDDSKPTGCIQTLPVIHGLPVAECADAFSTWNQLRPGVFDGGYAFGPPAGQPSLTPGTYIVEVIPPSGYILLKEEDKNVDFGDSYTPSPLVLPPVCVGALHSVPQFLSLFPGQQTPTPNWFPGWQTPLCDRKQITVSNGLNAAVDFFLFTEVPKAARAVGFTNNDLAAEFNVFSPNFGEKLGPSFLPLSFKDWAGKEIVRVYTDEFGNYNALLPSTYTVNVPSPSGVSPNMVTLVINDPIMANGLPDPWYNPTYSVTPWTFEYFPGKTTYLDTPIVPMTAFASAGVGVGTDPATLTPVISSVTTPNFPGATGGPVICTNLATPRTVTITSVGVVNVLNPDYVPGVTGTLYIQRNYGFGGTQGAVTLNGAPLAITGWSDLSITATVPVGATTGQLMVTRGDNGKSAEIGVTLNIVNCATTQVVRVAPFLGPGINFTSIQAAIDAPTTLPGKIILVAAGTYNENVIMNKPVRLQGAGAGSTAIYANPNPVDKLQIWHARMNALGARDFAAFLLKDPFLASEASAVAVLGEVVYPGGNAQFPDLSNPKVLNPGNPFTVPGQAAIDGFNLFGSKMGGGIFAIAGARYLSISNNNINGNQGFFAGGIAVGTSDVGFDSQNAGVTIRNNKIHRNGGTDGAGGIGMNEGAHNYIVAENTVVGNFCRFKGAAFNHDGLSDNATIARNKFLFNENHFGALLKVAGDGGGIFVGSFGGTGAAGVAAIARGTGTVTIDGNLIQGNLTGAGYGGGIIAQAVNGNDVLNNPANPELWYRLNILNNVIVNNVAARAGGGIYLEDVVFANIINNTISNNDSTGTSRLSFPAGATDSTAQPAGVVSSGNSATLQANLDAATVGGPYPTFSNPELVNNIITGNRSYSSNAATGALSAPAFSNLGVINTVTPQALTPASCIVADAYADFSAAYQNILTSAIVIDEGGNNISVRYTPIVYDPNSGNYHITGGAASNAGADLSGPPVDYLADLPLLARDYDGQARNTATPDIGADEIGAVPTIFTIYASAGQGGTISPQGVVFATLNDDSAFAITPSPGFHIQSIIVDGVAQPVASPYTFTNVSADHTIIATFAASGDTIGIYRPSNQRFYLRNLNATGFADVPPFQFGISGDVPIVGNWDGVGGDTIGVYRPSNSRFYLRNSNTTGPASIPPFMFGVPGDTPIVGDWDGNGTTTVGVYRSSTSTFFLRNSNTTGNADVAPFVFGIPGDIPVVGDWDGNGTTTIGIYRPSDGTFRLINQNIPNPTEVIFFSYGTAGDVPIVGNWDAL